MTAYEFEFAIRFALWTTTLLSTIVLVHWAIRHAEHRMSVIGFSLKSALLTIHQFYWFEHFQVNALLSRHDSADNWERFIKLYEASETLAAYRWISTYALLAIILATILVLSPYLKDRFNNWWPLAASTVVLGLFWLGLNLA